MCCQSHKFQSPLRFHVSCVACIPKTVDLIKIDSNLVKIPVFGQKKSDRIEKIGHRAKIESIESNRTPEWIESNRNFLKDKSNRANRIGPFANRIESMLLGPMTVPWFRHNLFLCFTKTIFYCKKRIFPFSAKIKRLKIFNFSKFSKCWPEKTWSEICKTHFQVQDWGCSKNYVLDWTHSPNPTVPGGKNNFKKLKIWNWFFRQIRVKTWFGAGLTMRS